MAVDASHTLLRPAIIWMGRRAGQQSQALVAAAGEDRVHDLTGLNPDSWHSGPKAMWLRDKEPETYRFAQRLASVGGYLNAWLTGETVHDHANASSSLLYNLRRRDWSPDLVDVAELELQRPPAVVPAVAMIGTLRPEVAKRLGLSRGTRVVAGTGADHAAALGAGASSRGSWSM